MTIDVENALPFFADLSGKPLQGGQIFFGVAGQNPVTSAITVYWDAAATQPVAQPVAVANGLTTRNGTPARVYVPSAYSRLVLDSSGRQVSYDASLAAPLRSDLASSGGASFVGWISGLAGSVARTLFARLLGMPLDLEEFGAVGDGITDDLTALTNAVASGKRIVAQRGKTYKFTNTLTITDQQIDFSGCTLLYTGAKNQFAMVINSTSGNNGKCDVRGILLKNDPTNVDTVNRTHGICLGGSCGMLNSVRIEGFTGISLALGSGAESYTGVTLPAALQCFYWDIGHIAFASTSGWNLVVRSGNNANHFRNISHFPWNGFLDSIPHAANCINCNVQGGTANTLERVSMEANPSAEYAMFLATANTTNFLGVTYVESNPNWATPPYPRITAQVQSSANRMWIRHSHNAVVPFNDLGTANDLRNLPGFYINGSQVYQPGGGINMVKNGRFENGQNGWTDSSVGGTITFGTGYLSGKSMRIDVVAGRPNVFQDLVAADNYALAALISQNITVSGYVKTNLAGLVIDLAAANQNQVPADDAWHWFTTTIKVPTTATTVSVQLITNGSGLTGYAEWSNVTAVLGNEPQAVGPRDALTGSKAYDPPSIAAGAQLTTTVTCTGAALGDFVSGVSFSLDLQGMSLTGYVSAADTVTALFKNGTAGAIDLAVGTLGVRVTKV